MNNIRPRALQKGDVLGIISPSSPLRSKSIDLSVHFLEEKGFKLKFGSHYQDEARFLAGSDADRAKDIMSFFADPKIKAIICSRGGQGSQRLLPLLDYEIIAQNPKALIGFSDTTALQLGLLKKTGLISYTGFTLTKSLTPLIKETLLACLMNEPYCIVAGECVNPGIVQGSLIGGNLSLITSLIGTPYQPDFRGKILLLEDVATEPFNVDRMLSHLELASVFAEVAGIVFGTFEQCISKDPEEGTIDEVITEWSTRIKVPCIKFFPYSHGEKSCVLPLGGEITLNASASSLSF
ncbi:S66 peptidase family protein [Legionella parisiensis]|uniref:Putative murein peptide carboxypeptidase n=1 Tax=Legionella parisiensis TaxID=45071 RepID=A0A1E5JQK9_9GAMM|nr:LD-carboxypeptidase [Legionella parisiensis]KTD43199.1 muramoyltetrapeptide carboxypeptidase [Legionella parisiensis]OEH46827.1 putative murein peptide carboxypeptidase [Legionella parisiensis]STX77720.1 Muramoyltetrapeptide carboxypeptidase [Legionella parisiensis]